MNQLSDIAQLFSSLPAPAPSFTKAFAFSVHKSGSSLMTSLLTQYCRTVDFPIINIPEILFHEGFFEKDWHQLTELREVIKSGYLYLGFRALPEILNPTSKSNVIDPCDFRSCLLVRDPRDCLVSQYFSMGRSKSSSHALPKNNPEALLKTFEKQVDQDIDSYVLDNCQPLFSKLTAYTSIVESNPNIRVFRYEDIYFDKLAFLINMLVWLTIPVDHSVAAKIAKRNDIRPVKEDLSKHIRKGTPGDYSEKLSIKTISKINAYFGDLMANYGYSLEG
ncbi:MAG: sulfotransferase domain-containing protein [Cyanobacteria bacterium P01_H01_bin.26]